MMFHFANAAILPLLGEMLAKGQGRNSMWSRKPLLLGAFAAGKRQAP